MFVIFVEFTLSNFKLVAVVSSLYPFDDASDTVITKRSSRRSTVNFIPPLIVPASLSPFYKGAMVAEYQVISVALFICRPIKSLPSEETAR